MKQLLLITILLITIISGLTAIEWMQVSEITIPINSITEAGDALYYLGEGGLYKEENSVITEYSFPGFSFRSGIMISDTQLALAVVDGVPNPNSGVYIFDTTTNQLTQTSMMSEPKELSYNSYNETYYCTSDSGLYLSYNGLVWSESELITNATDMIAHVDDIVYLKQGDTLKEADVAGETSFAYAGQGTITAPELTEISGMVASQQHPGVYWAITDSGADAVVYALTEDGTLINTFMIPMSDNRDYEDIALGKLEGDDQYYIFIGDIGDNANSVGIYQIYVISEPDNPYGVAVDLPLDNVFHFQYPDFNYDSETLMYDQPTGNFYIMMKADYDNADVGNKLFELAAPQVNGLRTVVEVAQPDFPPDFMVQRGATGGDISFNGDDILVRTYDHVYYWYRSESMSVPEAMSVAPTVLPYNIEAQGESVCWSLFTESYLTASETVTNINRYQRNLYNEVVLPFSMFNEIGLGMDNTLQCAVTTEPNYGIKELDGNTWLNLVPDVQVDKFLQIPNGDFIFTGNGGQIEYHYGGVNVQIGEPTQTGIINNIYYHVDLDRIILATSSGVVYGDVTTSTEENNQPEAVRISVSPNPFANGVELSLFFKENSEFSDLEIFNVRGERVRRLNYPHINNRELTLFWDGKDDEGRVVPSGVYFYRVGNDRSRGVGKMVKIK